MNLQGRRIHIVGSADSEADEKKLEYVHSLVSDLTTVLAIEGTSFVISFGKIPFLKDRTEGPSIIFDWTVADAVHRLLKGGRVKSTGSNGRLVTTVMTTKTETHIPLEHRSVYDELRQQNAVSMESLEPGWSAGAVVRPRLAQLGDILICISGGQGSEQLAIEYSSKGKPVIPLDINIGSSSRDGSGGASRLFDRALAEPAKFFKVSGDASATDLLDRTRTCSCEKDISKVTAAIMELLHALHPPQVFYVRLLNDEISEYVQVDNFFRSTVDTLVRELGYEPLQIGIGKNDFAWMHQAIFDSLHHSAVVLVDITALRPNCFMELGYAFGNKQRVIVTARKGTQFPFDVCAFETFIWSELEDLAQRLERFRVHWARNINTPNLVRPTEVK